jgi:probable rRNA maturation factor
MKSEGVTVMVAGRSPLGSQATTRIIKTVLRKEGRSALISLTFVGRDAMRRLHARSKGVSRTADVLAFILTGPEGLAVGDIYICVWVARREARRLRLSVREELTRYVIHGVLHVLGYDHPDDESRLGSPMWRRQERYVTACR